MLNILICDDDRDIVSAVKIYLSAERYNVIGCASGNEALDILKKQEIHLIIMDIMMPGMDGITAVAQLRKTDNIPVIFLTAKSEDTDKILGLNIGGDDYVTKPFNPVELTARVKAQLRRYISLGGAQIAEEVLTIGGIVLNDAAKTVSVDGEAVTLTPTEFDILRLLMKNPGTVFSSSRIYSEVWNDSPLGAENTIAVHIRHIREKLEINPAEPRYLKVVWGQGYKIEGGGCG
ncbi:MAG: response regulator transcription factor [Eubacteriales bacterium]|nr:response regulator transcription factor [Eubacteriales bacterium]